MGSMAALFHDARLAVITLLIPLAIAAQWSSTLRGSIIVGLVGALIGLVVASVGVLGSSEPVPQPLSAQNARFVEAKAWDADKTWFATASAYEPQLTFPASFIVSDSLDELLSWIIRDFVTSWYGGISQSARFANEVDSLIRKTLFAVFQSLQDQDVVEALVVRIVPILTRHLKDFSEAERAVRGRNLNRAITESEELDGAIAKRYRDGKLHPAASLASSDPEMQRQEYLREVVSKLMPKLLPPKVIQSKSTSTLIRELFSRVLLGNIIGSAVDPDTWNQVLGTYGKSVLQDRKTVRKLRAALDEHALPAPSSPKPQVFPKLSPQDDERRFERFIRAIRLCNNLSDARRFRSEVASQLTRESMKEVPDNAFVKRLEIGKKILNQRVGALSAVGDQAPIRQAVRTSPRQVPLDPNNRSLGDLLRNASGLSYFMEYMDRQRLLSLVQFWIVVDGFRDPLEDTPESLEPPDSPGPWSKSDRHDIAQIYETYLTRPELDISSLTKAIVQDFLEAMDRASPEQYGKARGALLRAQKAVQEQMQVNHFPSFCKSDLFFKFLASDNSASRSSNPLPHEDYRVGPRASARSAFPENSTKSRGVRSSQVAQPPVSRIPPQTVREPSKVPLDSDHPLLAKRKAPMDRDESDPLFDHVQIDYGTDSDAGKGEREAASQAHVVEAVEAALIDIITDDLSSSEVREKSIDGSETALSLVQQPRSSGQLFPPAKHAPAGGGRGKPSIASLGLVSASSRIGVFMDDDLFGDEEKFIEDERADPEDVSETELKDDIQEAAPGDLGLSEAISALTLDIDRLHAQESVLDTLTRKAELTNNHSELRILSKSKASLQREMRRKELQRQQYIVQESDSSLYNRAKVEIKSVMVGRDDDGQEFAFYMVEVNRRAGEHMPAASWVVARRYSEFHVLHQRLRRMYTAVRHLNFPRRRLVMKLQTDFLQRRRMLLGEYLQGLLRLPAVCTSRALRAFLSQRPIAARDDVDPRDEREDLVSRIYSSVTNGMDEFLGNMPVLDQLSVAGQNILSAATGQNNNSTLRDIDQPIGTPTSQEAQAELEAFASQTFEPFVKPICDLFVEVFELNQSANWLRGRTLVIVLQQLLGGVVERKVRDVCRAAVSDDAVLGYITQLKASLWPNGSFLIERKQRTFAEKKQARTEASILLATLIPDLAGGVVGRANAQAAGRRLFAALNNSRLNTHLVFELLDEISAILFP